MPSFKSEDDQPRPFFTDLKTPLNWSWCQKTDVKPSPFTPPHTASHKTVRTSTSIKKENNALASLSRASTRVKREDESTTLDSESSSAKIAEANGSAYATAQKIPTQIPPNSSWLLVRVLNRLGSAATHFFWPLDEQPASPLTLPQSVARVKKENVDIDSISRGVPGRVKREDVSSIPKGKKAVSKKIQDPFELMGSAYEGTSNNRFEVEKPSRTPARVVDHHVLQTPPRSREVRSGPSVPKQENSISTRKAKTNNLVFQLGAEPISPPQSQPRRANNYSFTFDTPTKAPVAKGKTRTSLIKREGTPIVPPIFSLPSGSSQKVQNALFAVPIDTARRIFMSSDGGIPGYSVHYQTVEGAVKMVYKTPSGEILHWYQTVDLILLFLEEMSRYLLRITGDRMVYEMVQGKILNYEMGLGKTYVACALLDLSRIQRAMINKQRGIKTSLKPDLVIVPLSLQPQWVEHLALLSGGYLIVAIFSGGRSTLHNAHVILCNIEKYRNQYKCLLEYQERIDGEAVKKCLPKRDWTQLTADDIAFLKTAAPLVITEFNTVVIDECHRDGMANSGSLGGRALLHLKADNFLLLSGTPAQNGLIDMQIFYALLKHISKRKNFRELEKSHRQMDRARKTAAPMKPTEVLDLIGDVEVHRILAHCIITRKVTSSITGKSLIVLPARHNVRVEVLLSEKEWQLYVIETKRTYGFVRFLRQRQVCLHPELVHKSPLSPDDLEDGKVEYENISREYDVNIKDARFLKAPSNKTIRRRLELSDNALPSEVKELGIDQILNDEYISSKFKAVYTILDKVPRGEKTIIFSVFTSLLDVLGTFLDTCNIGFIKYDGRMTPKEKEKALHSIADDDACAVILVSTKAGGVGLNITACNHAIIFDPWWNPYVEEQAISRIYRIGQTREVHVYRIVCPGTIETRIEEIQDKKCTSIDEFFDRCAALTHKRDAEYEKWLPSAPSVSLFSPTLF